MELERLADLRGPSLEQNSERCGEKELCETSGFAKNGSTAPHPALEPLVARCAELEKELASCVSREVASNLERDALCAKVVEQRSAFALSSSASARSERGLAAALSRTKLQLDEAVSRVAAQHAQAPPRRESGAGAQSTQQLLEQLEQREVSSLEKKKHTPRPHSKKSSKRTLCV